MARYTDEQIQQVKQLCLLSYIQHQGYTLKRQGKDWLMHCPFHDDKTPSLVITPDKNLWHCLGACQVGGGIIDWVMKHDQVAFRDAVAHLLNYAGREGHAGEAQPAKPTRQPSENQAPSLSRCDDDAQTLLHRVVSVYQQNLRKSSQAMAYLASRGLADEKLLSTFHVGVSSRNLGKMLGLRSGSTDTTRQQLRGLGVLRETGNEHLAGCVVVPVINEGQVLNLYGRKSGKVNKDAPVHYYLPGGHQGVWNLDGLKKSQGQGCDTLILCEAILDAMTFWTHGIQNVTASYGINGFTASHLAALQALNVNTIVLAYDQDEAGNQAAVALTAQLTSEGFTVCRLSLPGGQDVNGYALSVPAPKTALNDLVVQALAQVNNAASATPEHPAKTNASKTDTPKNGTLIQVNDNEARIQFGKRHYRIRGLANNSNPAQMKLNIMVTVNNNDDTEGFDVQGCTNDAGAGCTGAFHVDSPDLYHAKQRQGYITQASVECGVEEKLIKSDLGNILRQVESLQAQAEQADDSQVPELTEAEKDAALALLQQPDLLAQIQQDFTACGVVGEQSNTLVGYLACISRKLDKPLAVIIQSTSAAGKSALMDAILHLVPEEDRTRYSAMTGQSLFYMGESDLKHKILAISEEEGATQAAYALKLLQSQGELTMASTGKDALTGQLVTQEYRVEGPTMLFLTTTAIDIDEELLNRCLVLTVNESREQTQRIHELQRQRRTLDGLKASVQQSQIVGLHQNAQRLLRPLKVVNPYARQLTFPQHQTRTRRDHEKYLTLIDSIALLHQYQREVKTLSHEGQLLEYIEVRPQDIEQANRLAHDTLGRTLDELPPRTRALLRHINELVTEKAKSLDVLPKDIRFSRRDIREYTGQGNTQLKVHCQRLEDMEYLIICKGGRGKTLEYALNWQPPQTDNQPVLAGLIDIKHGSPERSFDEQKSGLNDNKSGSGREEVGGVSGSGRPVQKARQATPDMALTVNGAVQSHKSLIQGQST